MAGLAGRVVESAGGGRGEGRADQDGPARRFGRRFYRDAAVAPLGEAEARGVERRLLELRTWVGELQFVIGAFLCAWKESTVVVPAVKEQILHDLDQLSAEQQRHAADLVHRLTMALPKGASIADLLRLVGTLDDRSAREMMEAIEEGCERVDLDGW